MLKRKQEAARILRADTACILCVETGISGDETPEKPPGKKGDGTVNAYETINDILVNLFNEILKLEEEAIITDEFKDITNNDMHTIEAIGLSGGNTMSVVAKKLGITAGSLTTAINSLVNKKYVVSKTKRRRPQSCIHRSYRKRKESIQPS